MSSKEGGHSYSSTAIKIGIVAWLGTLLLPLTQRLILPVANPITDYIFSVCFWVLSIVHIIGLIYAFTAVLFEKGPARFIAFIINVPFLFNVFLYLVRYL